jgi:hypothetical protein
VRDRKKILASGEYYHPPSLPKISQGNGRCRLPTEKTSSMSRKACPCPTTPQEPAALGQTGPLAKVHAAGGQRHVGAHHRHEADLASQNGSGSKF